MAVIIDRRNSFNGGELSPWIDPRTDVDKYRSGCGTMRNFLPSIYGGAFRRPGSIYLGAAKNADKIARLERFEFSVTTTFVLEFGEFYIRFWTTGDDPSLVDDPDDPGNPLEVVTPWTADQVNALQFAQQNDIVYIVHPTTRPQILTRFTNTNWTLSPIVDEWPASLDENITTITLEVTGGDPPDTYPAWTPIPPYVTGDRVSYGGKSWRCIRNIPNLETALKPPGTFKGSYLYWTELDMSFTFGIGQTVAIESSEDFFDEGHVGSTFVIKHRRDDPSVDLALTSSVNVLSDELFVLGEWACNVEVNVGGTWEVKCVVERSFDLLTWETIRSVSSTGGTSGTVTGIELDPCYLRLRTTKKEGTPPATGSFTMEASDSYHYGILFVTDFVDAQEVTARVVFPPVDGETTHWNEPAWSDYRGFPRAVCFHENRIMFGGSTSRPQTIWGSVIDDYSNFRLSADDDSGLSFTLASDAANGIQWIVSQESLIIGTTGSEWTIGTRENQSALTPSTVAAKRSTTYGSSPIQAAVVSDAVLFIQRSGRKVREFVYTFEEDGYTAQDLTLLSEHITDSGIVQIAVQKNPETVLWAICGNGDLVGVVYERGQNVAGWFRVDTGVSEDGSTRDYYESIAIVSGDGEEDERWVLVRREIDGETVRYIERFQPNVIRKLKNNEQLDLCYVDSAVIVEDETPFGTVTGLDHLEGREVAVLTNGSPEANKTVSGGSITLDFDDTTVAVVGIPIESILTPTPLETNDPNTTTRYSKKKVSDLILQVWKSSGFEATASDGENWTKLDFRQPSDFMDQAVPDLTGTYETVCLASSSTREARISIKQTQPLPLNVLSMLVKYDVNAT